MPRFPSAAWDRHGQTEFIKGRLIADNGITLTKKKKKSIITLPSNKEELSEFAAYVCHTRNVYESSYTVPNEWTLSGVG